MGTGPPNRRRCPALVIPPTCPRLSRRSVKLRRVVVAALLSLVAACSGDKPTQPALPLGGIHLTIVSGNAQVGAPSTELPAALVAMVTDDKGRPVKDRVVNFRVVSGGGSVYAGAAMSNALGHVRDYWTLGTTGSQVVEVRAVDPASGAKQTFATFTATFPIPVDFDADGFTVAQGDCNDASASVNPGTTDLPDPTFTDNDCDGVDGNISAAVFVSVAGTNGATCGTMAAPCATITFGMARAVTLARTQVYIAVGTYNETVQLTNGVSLYGGFASTFLTRSNAQRGLITGSAQYQTTGIMYTVLGENLTQSSAFTALVVQAPNATGQQTDGSGRHSAGILLRNVSPGINITHSDVIAGSGSAGLAGVTGTSASQTPAPSGGPGGNANEIQTACDATSRGTGGNGGGSSTSQGGDGGAGGTMDTDCDPFSLNFTARPGLAGTEASVFGAGYGTGGPAGGLCLVGQPGVDGRQVNGANGAGGNLPAVVSGFLVLSSGATGALGSAGTGGGGGGGSGGCDPGTDAHGAGGGGGGSGGQRATTAGAGGRPGGASIGIYLSNAIATIQGVNITRGNGGNGGAGGAGGLGQPGGSGGPGGQGAGAGSAQAGGDGGNGGAGGHSGGGGGGSGGISVGILRAAGSITTEAGNAFSGGAGGQGGAGGLRGDGQSAPAGTTGTVSTSIVP